ncbi:BPSL0761 family protein [Pseudomonas anguilliseptica]|uniref:BPSL0761 family protein n=1 Tax=Pseudomonas anguilliseptica TaxID=53406 RepID=UPI00373528A6
MTMPHERTRAVLQTHDFLVELSRDTSLPERVRRDARFLLRHYPSRSDMLLAGRIEENANTLPIGALGPVFSSTITSLI